MDKCIDSLEHVQIFLALEQNSGYLQIELDTFIREKTAFISHHGLYQFIRMQFCLKNAPATLQCVMDIILSLVKGPFSLVHLDDTVILLRAPREPTKHILLVLSFLKEGGVTSKLEPCVFFTSNIDYLRHTIRPGRLEVDIRTTDALSNLKIQTTQTEF